MANDDLTAPVGDFANIVPEDRLVEKQTKCANCIHWTSGPAVLMTWLQQPAIRLYIDRCIANIDRTGLRVGDFDEGFWGLEMARMCGRGLSSEQAIEKMAQMKLGAASKVIRPGEPVWMSDRRVSDIRSWIHGLKDGKVGFCVGGGVNRDGLAFEPTALVTALYQCHNWTGKEGWSLDHEPGRKLDPLPAEAEEMADAKARKVEP